MKKKKIIALICLIVLLAGVAGLIAMGLFFKKPDSNKIISAWMSNAECIGKDGVVMQTKSNECGPCALKMIFDFYDIDSSLEEIERGIDLTEQGSSMLTLKKFAELKGLKAEGWNFTLEDFLKSSFPSILYVNNNHFVVADSVLQDTIYIRNPAIGRLKIEKNRLCKIWNGETLVFGSRD